MSSRVIISIMNTIMNIIIAAEHSDSNAPGTLKKSLDILDAVGKFVFVVYRNVIDIYQSVTNLNICAPFLEETTNAGNVNAIVIVIFVISFFQFQAKRLTGPRLCGSCCFSLNTEFAAPAMAAAIAALDKLHRFEFYLKQLDLR